MTPALDIRGSGRSFFILHQGARVGGPYTGHGNAVAALRGVEQRLAPRSAAAFRKCKCGASFMATTARRYCHVCAKTGGR